MTMVWKCQNCGQNNYDKYYACMQCLTEKDICADCGAVNCETHVEEEPHPQTWLSKVLSAWRT